MLHALSINRTGQFDLFVLHEGVGRWVSLCEWVTDEISDGGSANWNCFEALGGIIKHKGVGASSSASNQCIGRRIDGLLNKERCCRAAL
jgi:hypothetical protein